MARPKCMVEKCHISGGPTGEKRYETVANRFQTFSGYARRRNHDIIAIGLHGEFKQPAGPKKLDFHGVVLVGVG